MIQTSHSLQWWCWTNKYLFCNFFVVVIFISWFWVLFPSSTESGWFCNVGYHFSWQWTPCFLNTTWINTFLSIPFLAINFIQNIHVYVCVYVRSMVNNIIITKFWLSSDMFWFLNIFAKSCKCLTGKWYFCKQLEVTIFSFHHWSVLLLHEERNYL